LIILFYPDLRGIPVVVLRACVETVERRDGVPVNDGGILLILYPDLMTGEEDIVGAVGVLDADGGLHGAILIEGLALILVGVGVGGFVPVGHVNDEENGGEDEKYDDVSAAHEILVRRVKILENFC
jgi:hypothetical protein